jgi:hypothetical protein
MAIDQQYGDYLSQLERQYGLQPGLLASIVQVESKGNPKAVSAKGAQGILQTMPGTARMLGIQNPFDPYEQAGKVAPYLSRLSRKYGSNTSLIAAAYNAGEGAVDKHGGIPPYSETRGYVRKVLDVLIPAAQARETVQQRNPFLGLTPPAQQRNPFLGLTPPAQKNPFLDLKPTKTPSSIAIPTFEQAGRAFIEPVKRSAEISKEEYLKGAGEIEQGLRHPLTFGREKPGGEFKLGIGDVAWGALRALSSPVTGLIRGGIAEPVGKVTGVPEEYIEAPIALGTALTVPSLVTSRFGPVAGTVANIAVGNIPETRISGKTKPVAPSAEVTKPEVPTPPAVNPITGEAEMHTAGLKALSESMPWGFTPAYQQARKSGTFSDAIRKIIAPASRGKEAEATAGIIRAQRGEEARQQELAYHALYEHAKAMDALPQQEKYEFIDRMQHGTRQQSVALDDIAGNLRKLLDDRREQVRDLGTGKLEHFYENYFPHIWLEREPAEQFYHTFGKSLTGSGSFLKHRHYDYFLDGLRAGLKPVSDNPIELALLKVREMDRYIYGQKIFQQMKEAGLAKFFRPGEAPAGWVRLDDKVAHIRQFSDIEKGVIERGNYYAPETAAVVFNNHVGAGLQGNAIYDLIRGSSNMLNQAQLGFSAFHLGFTTADVITSQAALGTKQISRGLMQRRPDYLAKGIWNWVTSPFSVFTNPVQGYKLRQAYLANPKYQELRPYVEALVKGGGRIAQDPFYRNTAPAAFRQAVRLQQYGRAAKEFLPTVMDRATGWLFEHVVPIQKLGVFYKLVKDFNESYPQASTVERNAAYRRFADTIDDRLGQVIYDNLFWDRAFKDLAMISVRSVGWNLGTLRQLGGGITDLFKPSMWRKKELSDRAAYVITLPIMTGMAGALYQYLATGERPTELRDYFYPKNGGIRQGQPDRDTLPTYMKDVVGWGTSPWETAKHKINPLASTVVDMLNNEDFYGALIMNPEDPLVRQIGDEAKYMANQFLPFSWRNAQQQAITKGQLDLSPGEKLKNWVLSRSQIGITPAPGWAVKTPGQQHATELAAHREAAIKKARQLLKEGRSEEAEHILQSYGLKPRQIRQIERYSTP